MALSNFRLRPPEEEEEGLIPPKPPEVKEVAATTVPDTVTVLMDGREQIITTEKYKRLRDIYDELAEIQGKKSMKGAKVYDYSKGGPSLEEVPGVKGMEVREPPEKGGRVTKEPGEPFKKEGSFMEIESFPEKPPGYLERDYSDKQGFLDHYIDSHWKDRGDPVLWKPAEIAESENIPFDDAVKQQKQAIREFERVEQRFDQEATAKEKIDKRTLAQDQRDEKKEKEVTEAAAEKETTAKSQYLKLGNDRIKLSADYMKLQESLKEYEETEPEYNSITSQMELINSQSKRVALQMNEIKKSFPGIEGVAPVEEPGKPGEEYKTPEEIRDAFKAGKITRDQAKQYYLQITTK